MGEQGIVCMLKKPTTAPIGGLGLLLQRGGSLDSAAPKRK